MIRESKMKNDFDVIALGELLIDFTPTGKSEAGFPVFECNPGGAPPNVLTGVTRLGGTGAFIGKVGSDELGKLLIKTLQKENINTQSLYTDNEIGTTLAFVTLDDTGNRSFSFFRNPGADTMLNEDEIDEELIKRGKIFHYGSLSCTGNPSKGATLKAIDIAKKNGSIISFDPNLRLSLWTTEEEAKNTILDLMQHTDIVKLNDEEFEFLTGESDYEKHASEFMQKYSIKLMFVTLGSKGAFYALGGNQGKLQTYDVKVVDTTGSGDSFMGACLYKICTLCKNIDDIADAEIKEIVDFANASGSIASTKKGGIPSIPTLDNVMYCMKNTKKMESRL